MLKVIEILGEPIQHGGQEKFLQYLILKINPEIAIDVITPYFCDNQTFVDQVQSKGGKVFEIHQDFNPGQSRRAIYKPLLLFLKENQFDIVHIHSGSVSVLAYAARAAKKAGVKRVIVHSHSTGIKSLKHFCVKTLYGQVIKHNATDFLACSYQAGEMKYPASVLKNRLVIISNGIQIDSYKRNDETRKRQRALLGISEKTYVIGHVGRFTYQKNHKYLIEVFQKIHEKIPDSRLLLVGEGELMEEIKQQVNNLHLEAVVIFTGSVDNVQDYYQAMDVFLFPSNFEGLGYVLLEAQAAGLPCIASTAVPEDVVLSEMSFIIDLTEENRWVQKAIEYQNTKSMNNDEAIRRAGYDIEKTITQINDLYLAQNHPNENGISENKNLE